ncbi:MAG: type I phosphomannose isomerase catalytic subunit [Mycoplasmoidaceae bacterium]
MDSINIIFLKPYLDEKIWGGNRLKEYGYELKSNNIGEALIVSALEKMPSTIINKELFGVSLKDFYESNRDFFGNYCGEYPILTKIIDANDDLSVQVHPDNEYAKIRHNKLGKNECWYILDAKENASIIYGLKTNNRKETEDFLNKKKWDDLLNEIKVKKGDVIYVESGIVHAIKKGILIYELQQSSDITYRLYDYDRIDDYNNPRELHIEDALNVIKYNNIKNACDEKNLISNEYFSLMKIDIDGTKRISIDNAKWLEVTVIDGSGTVDNLNFKKGSIFLIRNNYESTIIGKCSLLIGYVKK